MRMLLENTLLWKVSWNKRNENLEKVKNKNYKFFSQRYQLLIKKQILISIMSKCSKEN